MKTNGNLGESTEWLFSSMFPGRNWNFEKLVSVGGGKPEYQEKNPRNRERP